MAGKILGGIGPTDRLYRPHPPKRPQPPKVPKPKKGRFAKQTVTQVAGQTNVGPGKGAAVEGKAKTPLLQRRVLPWNHHNLQPAAPITFKGSVIDAEYKYPIVRPNDLLPIRDLGEGAFGTVKLVWHRHTHQQLALKKVGDDTERRRECAQCIRIQRAIARKGGNPQNIVNLVALSRGKSDEKYVLLEFGGKDLYKTITEDGPFKNDKLKKTFFQAVKGVSTLYEAGYQHHDIKPENILINDKGIVKICDFGLAEIINKEKKQTCGGTPWYMPPEKVFQEDNWDNNKADSWSLGCTFAELCLGSPAFDLPLEMYEGKIPFEDAMEIISQKRIDTYLELEKVEGEEAADLFWLLTEPNPAYRLSPTEALPHSYFDSVR